ncbi:B-cell receptor CD22-like isoform X2 [Clarias gariepinus]|uniref:B-cell receptor CD22-like isoform X2 n=1 Tax=Clarias gariepinus TaxID=13013 RepID=UPI00234CA61F|nr:B-cell receptor CD22-like isoform X2 [Clarias gariepinus]
MVPSITASLPGPEAAKQPQTITLPPPYFTVELQVVIPDTVVEGKAVTLTCKTGNRISSNSTFIWNKNGSRLPSSTNLLHLPSVSRRDVGRYSCAVQKLQSCEVTLRLQYVPKNVLVSISPSGEIVEGSSVTLTCSSDANPPVELYTWYKGKSSIGTGKTYTISNISSAGSGNYTCQAKNKHGHQSSTAVSLNVLYPPKRVSVSISPSGAIVEGRTVTLTCSSDANPPAVYNWFKGTVLKTKEKIYIIKKIRSEDRGEYKCKSSNRYGEKHSDGVTLNVFYPPKSSSVSISPSGEIVEGRTVTLTCSSDANPPVEYNWFKGTLFISKGKTYTVKNISSENTGEYKCKSSNRYGEKYSYNTTVNVLYPPKNVSVSINRSGEIVEGSSVTLTCSSDANPPVELYTWYKGKSSIGTGKTYTISNINSVDSGDYTCQAKNKHGHQSSTAVSLNVLYPPKRVSVSISPSGAIVEGSTVTLTCSSDANPPAVYNWFKGTVLKSKEKIYIIKKIRSEDRGEYKCKSSNRYGEKHSDGVTLNVFYPPKSSSVSISPSGEIVEGRTVTLTCSSDANPPAEYTWFKGTLFISKGKTYTVKNISSENTGEYKCKSSNRYGEKYSYNTTVNVLYPPKNVSVSINRSGEIVEGSSVTLSCSSDANPPVELYTWYKVNESSPVGSGQSYSFTLSSNSSGWFYCVAQNKYGTQRAAAVPLILNGNQNVVLYIAVGIAGGCGCLFLIIGVLCIRKKRRGGSKDAAKSFWNVESRPPDDTYTALDLPTRFCNDSYHTRANADSSPPDDKYAAPDLPARSSNNSYHTRANLHSSSIDDTYTALDLQTMSSNDVYHTLGSVHPNPPDEVYTSLDFQFISSDYLNIPIGGNQH